MNPPEINSVDEASLLLKDIVEGYLFFTEQIPELVLGLLVFFSLYFAAGPIAKWLTQVLTYSKHSKLVQLVTERIISLLIILFGLYVLLRLVGLSEFAVAVLSGTGVAGLIIGFAFKDIAENFMSSLLLSIQRPFKLGELIEVNGHLGVVKQVTARATTLVDFDGNHIQIPNSIVYKNTIRNFTANPKMRGKFGIGIGYDNSVAKAQHIATKTLAQMEAILEEPEPQVLVSELGASAYILTVYFWTNSQKYSVLKVSSLAMKNITKAFLDENISMPDNDRERIFPQGITVNTLQQENSQSDFSDTQSRQHASHDLQTTKAESSELDLTDSYQDDLSSDEADIREQANTARDPEQGANIL